MLLILSGPKKKRAKSNTVPAISSMKRPIEDEHEDGNYQARSGKKRKTVTQATSAVSEHCTSLIKFKICWIKSFSLSIKLK